MRITKLQQAINEHGFNTIKNEYMSIPKTVTFIKKYCCSRSTAIELFGSRTKMRGWSRSYEKDPLNIREWIKTDCWERPKENKYWEKDWFEIVEQSYIKTKALH